MACECYKLNGPNSSPICFGTKECESCSCNGDKNKCDFNYFPKKENDFETLLENYNKLHIQWAREKIKLEEAIEKYTKINNQRIEANQAIRNFKEKINYDKLRRAVINFISDSVPPTLFKLIINRVYELDSDEIFILAREMEINCSDFIKGE